MHEGEEGCGFRLSPVHLEVPDGPAQQALDQVLIVFGAGVVDGFQKVLGTAELFSQFIVEVDLSSGRPSSLWFTSA